MVLWASPLHHTKKHASIFLITHRRSSLHRTLPISPLRRRQQRRRRRDDQEAMATSLACGVFPFPSLMWKRFGGDVGAAKVRRKLGGDNEVLRRPSTIGGPPGGKKYFLLLFLSHPPWISELLVQGYLLLGGEQAREEEEKPRDEMKEIWGACVVPAGKVVMV